MQLNQHEWDMAMQRIWMFTFFFKKAEKHFENQSTYPETFFTSPFDFSFMKIAIKLKQILCDIFEEKIRMLSCMKRILLFLLSAKLQRGYLFKLMSCDLGLIHTRHFGTQYCDKKIKRYCDKKTILRHRFL